MDKELVVQGKKQLGTKGQKEILELDHVAVLIEFYHTLNYTTYFLTPLPISPRLQDRGYYGQDGEF